MMKTIAHPTIRYDDQSPIALGTGYAIRLVLAGLAPCFHHAVDGTQVWWSFDAAERELAKHRQRYPDEGEIVAVTIRENPRAILPGRRRAT